MRHRIYLDSHFIDYLWDHRDYVWEGKEATLESATAVDSSPQLLEYQALGRFPEFCWLNDWRIVVGERVLDELRQVADLERRDALLDYATKLQYLEFQLREEEIAEFEPAMLVFPEVLDKALANLQPKDRLLIREAIDLQCDVFLTTDRKLLSNSHLLQSWFGLKACKLTEFIGGQSGLNTLSDFKGAEWPDILGITGMIP